MSNIIFYIFMVTGIATWAVSAILGVCFLFDIIAEWFIDSVRFKKYVVNYLREQAQTKDHQP